MKCPYCDKDNGSRVSRTTKLGDSIVRERICFGCHKVYETTEVPDTVDRRTSPA